MLETHKSKKSSNYRSLKKINRFISVINKKEGASCITTHLLILLYSNQISNCLLKKLSFQDSCTPHVKRKKTLSIPAFLYMVSSVPTFGTRDTNAWYERYHPLKFVVPMPGTSPTKGGIKLIPVRHRIQKGSPLHFNKAQRTSHIISSQTLFFGRLRSSLL